MKWLAQLPQSLAKRPAACLLKALFRSAIAVFIPAVFILGLTLFSAREDLNTRKAAQHHEMANILGQIAARSEPQKKFNKLFKDLANQSYPSTNFNIRLEQIFRANSESLEIFLYDSNGLIQPIAYLPPPPRFVAQRFLQAVTADETSQNLERWVLQFSGYATAHETLRSHPDSVAYLGGSHDRHWGGWFQLKNETGDKSGHLITFVRRSGFTLEKLLSESIKIASTNHLQNYNFAWRDPAHPDELNSTIASVPSDFLESANSVTAGETIFAFNGKSALKMVTDSGFEIYALAKQSSENSYLHHAAAFFTVLAALLAFIIIFPVFLGVSSLNPGIKFRLAAIFIFGAGVPLFMLFATGYIDRSDREKVMIDDYLQKNLAELRHIDESMVRDYRRLESTISDVINSYSHLSEAEFEQQLPELGHKLKDYSEVIRRLLVVVDGYKLIFELATPEKVVKGKLGTSMEYFGEMLLEIYRGEFVYNTAEPDNLKAVVRSSGVQFSRELLINSGKIDTLSLLDNLVLSYLDLFIDANHHARGVCFAYLFRHAIQQKHLKRVIAERNYEQNPQMPKIAALPVINSDQWPALPKAATGNHPKLQQLAQLVINRELPAHEIAIIENTKYLLSANRGKYLDGYVLIAAQPYSVIDVLTAKLNRQMMGFIVLTALLAILSAKTTSSLLLEPLGELKDGLKAITSGNLRTRVNGAKVEEFDSMISSLNKTLESFQEMQVAKSVQEHLWPEKDISGPGWELAGKCIPATDLGGDHFDWLELEDGRIFMAIGDVTGHGIAPAMIQASTKVWTAMTAQTAPSAAHFLKEIHTLHSKFGVKKILMTFWAAYFDPRTLEIDFASAGHNYPILAQPGEEPQYLKLPGLPLGARRNVQPTGLKLRLKPGSSLVLYTDGIVETEAQNGEMLGYDRLIELVDNSKDMGAAETINYLLCAASEWGLQNDDQTAIALKIAREAKNEAV